MYYCGYALAVIKSAWWQVTHDGLTAAEVEKRLAEYGPNKLPESTRNPILVYLGETLRSSVCIIAQFDSHQLSSSSSGQGIAVSAAIHQALTYACRLTDPAKQCVTFCEPAKQYVTFCDDGIER